MAEQMEIDFGDEGERVDPVSGNEVPIGSMPEEVRDDIPAQLSEGEYVVPADVVRYYGVKFFEDLRSDAKEGFQEMEANGRIGGDPVEGTGMEMADDELPFDISELQIVDDGAEEQPEMNEGGYVSGYAEGGMSVLPYNPALGSIFGTSASSGGTGSGFEIRTYVGPSGQKLFLQFLNGEPLSPIPEGYTLEGGTSEQVSEQVATTATTGSTASTVGANQNTSTNNGDNDDPFFGAPKPKKAVDWSDPDEATPDKFLETYNQMTGTGGTFMKYAIGAVGGPLLGLGIKGAEKLQMNSMIKGIDSQIAAAKAAGADTTNLIEIKNVLEGKNRDGTARADASTSDAVLSGATYKNNSFSETLANLLTPDDGASYVNGQLIDDNTKQPIQPGGMTDSGRKIKGWANDPDNDVDTQGATTEDTTPAAFSKSAVGKSLRPVRRPPSIEKAAAAKTDDTREATLSYNPQGTNTAYMNFANTLTPTDGRSYVGGQLIDDKTQEPYVPPKKDTVTTSSGQAVKINTESTKEGTVGTVVGNQYAGDGFEWKKADNGNYFTRTYTGNNEGATGSNSTATSTSSSSAGNACFLTTAIVERRGESDNGPTLTKLRDFRDTYLVSLPNEVEEYYKVAPKIVAAIPESHKDWDWIGSQIDTSIYFIDRHMPDEAYNTYKAMVIKLKKDWI